MQASRQNNRFRDGSALILVVVVTTLLAVVGVMFVMVTRVRDITSSNVADNRNLDHAVQSVVALISKTLTDDLLGTSGQLLDETSGTEAYDHPIADPWLASLEPVLADQRDATNQNDDWYRWEYVTDLTGSLSKAGGKQWDQVIKDGSNTIPEYPAASSVAAGKQADADGDGVADSMWIVLPDVTTVRGEPVYAAVRIIDNCAMLNLNTAYCFYQEPYSAKPASPFQKPWYIRKGIAYGGSFWADGGRYLAEINYLPLLRGSDLNSTLSQTENSGWYNIFTAKNFGVFSGGTLTSQLWPSQVQNLLENMGTMGASYRLFDIGDELELRNRFILTSGTEARIESKDIANYTLDAGGGDYAALRIPRDSSVENGVPNLAPWKWRIDYRNFNVWEADGQMKASGSEYYNNSYKYDRRHICTTYSFDRNIRSGRYLLLDAALSTVPTANRSTVEEYFRPLNRRPVNLGKLDITSNTTDAKKNILHVLYALRDCYYYDYLAGNVNPTESKLLAARKAAQITANMIDYLDDNSNPTFFTKTIIDQLIREVDAGNYITNMTAFDFGLAASDTIYGYEMQPFISEVCTNYNTSVGGALGFAVELVNPYPMEIKLGRQPDGWTIRIGTDNYFFDDMSIPAASSELSPGRLTVYAGSLPASMQISGTGAKLERPGMGLMTALLDGLYLQRPDPANSGQYIIVDEITEAQKTFLMTGDGVHATKRQDTAWKFTNKLGFVNDSTPTLGNPNGVSVSRQGYPLPVANDSQPINRLADFQRIPFVSNTTLEPEPNAITALVAKAADESAIRFNPVKDARMLRYLCTMDSDTGILPGRININTAPQYVIAAAIPPNLVITTSDSAWWINPVTLAEQIVHGRPYTKLSDLVDGSIKPSLAAAMQKYFGPGSTNVGDMGIENDYEEQYWVFNRLANIFTVRSDTFTAYILVRLGTDGPQRRMIAIFDRSNVWQKGDVPRLVALHPVPDPR